MIKVEGISKKFSRTLKDKGKRSRKEEFFAVNNISFQAQPGDVFGILGPNGAGKTTLLRMLGGIMTPSAGSVQLLDKSYQADPNGYKRAIGYLSGNTKLYGRMTPRELLLIFSELYDIPRHRGQQRVEEIVELLDMADFSQQRIENLSTGQTQRVSIARCLVHQPQLYIFDEPTLGLDVLSSHSIIEFMKAESKQGKMVVYSTHYMEEAETICNKILLMHKGEAIAMGSPNSLKSRTGTNNVRDAFIALLQERGEDIG